MSDLPQTEQEPVAWSLIWPGDYGVNAKTTFKTEAEARAYAGACIDPKPTVVPLYAAPVASCSEGMVALRRLVDIVWQHATESTAVPSTKTADMLIERAALSPSSEASSQAPDEYFEMLWAWFEDESRAGKEGMRPERREGLSADDFKAMLDEHEAELCAELNKAFREIVDLKMPLKGSFEAIVARLERAMQSTIDYVTRRDLREIIAAMRAARVGVPERLADGDKVKRIAETLRAIDFTVGSPNYTQAALAILSSLSRPHAGCACTSIDRSHCNEPDCPLSRPNQQSGDDGFAGCSQPSVPGDTGGDW